MISYNSVIIFSWAAFLVVWGITAFNVKPDIRKSKISRQVGRFWFLCVILAVVVARMHLLSNRSGDVFDSAQIFFVSPLFLDWIGALLAVLGIGIAVWARVNIGRNWSPRPAVKEQHELVTSGPYKYVRHPIYTGVLLATLGTALTGTVFGAIMLVFACVVFLLRVRKEENIMLRLFPDQYPDYQKRTKRLVPFVW